VSSYLQVSQNYNPGWVATLKGHTLPAIQLDGWQQGWKVPAGPGGTITMTFRPDSPYRLGLGLGALFLVLLACLALFGRRTSSYAAVGPHRRLPFALLAGSAFLITLLIGGPVMALLLVPLWYLARRWGSDLMAAIAGVSFLTAGVIVALNPGTVPGYHVGAFSASVQFLSVAAIAAVLCTVVVDDRAVPTAASNDSTEGPA
jgi:arabinofuranan 3-O-arabinosyltransferase